MGSGPSRGDPEKIVAVRQCLKAEIPTRVDRIRKLPVRVRIKDGQYGVNELLMRRHPSRLPDSNQILLDPKS